jgi:hypothetical protein
MAAPGYEPLASGRVNDGFGSNLPVRRGGKVSNRRVSPVVAHSGDRLLSEPIAGTQASSTRTALHAPLQTKGRGPPASGRVSDAGGARAVDLK